MLVSRPLDRCLDLSALHRLDPRRYPMLLESSASGSAQGRWDLLLVSSGAVITLGRDEVTRDADGVALEGRFLDVLDADWSTLTAGAERSRWPFRGGWALYLGYELATQVEPVLVLPGALDTPPIAVAVRCPAAIVRDHASGDCTLVVEAGSEWMADAVLADCATLGTVAGVAWKVPLVVREAEPAAFIRGVEQVLGYLAAGDVFQVNLSRGWEARFDGDVDAAALFARLRQYNPAPFAGLFAYGGWSVVSASPERLVCVHGDRVQARPIAGTAARFAGDDDLSRRRELAGHPKERAEHVMLIDLERNDLGRVCQPGSIHVDELMSIESYAHVHHIVSNVSGRLRSGVTPGQVIAAVFPGGTITGCPKIRCMQIIAELEGMPRGAYTGAMGWLDRSGDMDLNILIRSAEIVGDTLRFRTGAGIVADSQPQRELDETRAKARGMLRALGVDA